MRRAARSPSPLPSPAPAPAPADEMLVEVGGGREGLGIRCLE